LSDLKAAALRYAKAGLAVLPCNGKVPLLPGHGFKDATTDADVIEHRWTVNPSANIGIVPGSAGLLVVDIDVKGEVDGHDALDILEREHGKLPDTRTALTPSGGVHYYYRVPEGETFGNRRVGEGGIDIRADKGYVIAPPSSICGKWYRWTNSIKAAPLPDDWVELLRERPYVPPASPPDRPIGSVSDCVKRGSLANYLRKAYTDEGIALRDAPEGARNDAVNDYGFALGQLVHLGLKVEDIEAQLEWAAAQWSWSRGRRNERKDHETLRRAVRDGGNNPRKVAGHG
jgi:hypothetical protein